jgi:hypothetical protein
MLGTCPLWLSSICGWLFHFLMHFLYNYQLIEEKHMLVSFHININKTKGEPYKYSIRKQRLSISHSVAMSDMPNLHHNCNIWITSYIDKKLLMALWPSMNTCKKEVHYVWSSRWLNISLCSNFHMLWQSSQLFSCLAHDV